MSSFTESWSRWDYKFAFIGNLIVFILSYTALFFNSERAWLWGLLVALSTWLFTKEIYK